MNDREYFLTTSLSYQLQAARRELAGFRSGEIYQKLRADYEGIIREKDLTIRKLQKELDGLSFSRRKVTEQWMDVLEDVRRVNGANNNVVVCSNGAATMYFARECKGHAGIKDTPVEAFGGILIHDHEACFYSYGSDHQECMVHIERYLRDSIENEKGLTWNGQMLALIPSNTALPA